MLDQVQDLNQAGMFQLHTILEFPEFVKEAAQATMEDVRGLDLDRFAYPSQRMLPMHTKSNTWLSAAYLHKFGSDLPHREYEAAAERLQKAAEYWGIEIPGPDDVAVPPPVPEVQYTITYPLQNQSLACTACSGEDLLKVASDMLSGGKYPLAVRQDVAAQVLRAPAEMISALPDQMLSDLQKVAGMGIGTEQAALTAIGQRRHATQHYYKPIGDGLRELEGMIKDASIEGLLSYEMTQKTATMLDAIDRFAGLHERYNDTFQPPERQLFNVTLADFDTFTKLAVRLPNGDWVRKADLEQVIPFLQESLGEKCASVEEAVECVQAMPERRAKILSQHLKGCGADVL
jgi:hypothetical protein